MCSCRWFVEERHAVDWIIPNHSSSYLLLGLAEVKQESFTWETSFAVNFVTRRRREKLSTLIGLFNIIYNKIL